MPDIQPVCKRCGGTTFDQVATVEIHVEFTRKVLELAYKDDGSFVERVSSIPDSNDAEETLRNAIDQPDIDGYVCKQCGTGADTLKELVFVMPAAGVKFTVADGRTLEANRVFVGDPSTGQDPAADGRELSYSDRILFVVHSRIEGDEWSIEVFAIDEEGLELWEPNPDQLALLEAA